MEQSEWRVEFRWINAHVGHRGNEMANVQSKDAEKRKNTEECCIRIPKSVVMSEQNNKVLSGGKKSGKKQLKLQ